MSHIHMVIGETYEQYHQRCRDHEEQERLKIEPLFNKAIASLGMKRIGIGENDLHANDKYTLFVATFPRTHVLLCDLANTTALFGFDCEGGLEDMLLYVKRRK